MKNSIFTCLLLVLLSALSTAWASNSCHVVNHNRRVVHGVQTPLVNKEISECTCAAACDVMAQQKHMKVYYPDDDQNFSMWDAKQLEYLPTCRVEPTSTDEVATALSVLVDNWCTFAVKSGGHSRIRGSSNAVGGVTIDLNRINTIELLENNKKARIGSGALWGDVYTILEKHGVVVSGGRLSGIGVGGFTLGGGISYIAQKYGWGSDNVLEYTVVLPNTTIVNVSEDEHPELYFALRGGGNNFGIVTHFTFKTHPQKKMWGGTFVYPDSLVNQVVNATYNLITAQKEDPNVAFWQTYAYVPDYNMLVTAAQPMYTEPIEQPPVFNELLAIPTMSARSRIDWMSAFTYEIESTSPRGVRNIYSTISFAMSKEVMLEIIDIYREEVEAVKSVRGILAAIVFQPVSVRSMEVMNERGGNAIGLDLDTPLTIFHTNSLWLDANDDLAVETFVNRLISRSRDAAIKHGVFHPFVYMNYANDNQDVYGGYKPENVARLKNIQKQIDTKGVFTSKGLCNVYFKLS